MKSKREPVQSFFDRLAPAYRRRYEGKRVFLRYLHEERLEKALAGLGLSGKKVLDIGAGTGILYDRLLKMNARADYYACDISAAMLAQSSIPEERRWTGTPRECVFPVDRFDAVFLLGVTPYLTEEELADMLAYIAEHLAENGIAVLGFANRLSLDFRIRRVLRLLFGPLLGGTVLGLPVRGYSLKEVKEMMPPALAVAGHQWLNATVFPFNRLFPRLSVRFSKWVLGKGAKEWFCGDFLVFIALTPRPPLSREVRFTHKSGVARGFGPTPDPSLNQGGERFALIINGLISISSKS